MTKLVLAGAAGRMGYEVLTALADTHDIKLTQALVSKNSKNADKSLPHPSFTSMKYSTRVNSGAGAEVMVVFALPDASIDYLQQAKEHNIAVVMCTTGFDDSQLQILKKASQDIAVLFAPNTSLGIFWLARLAGQLAKSLPQADIEIVEAHHRNKVDAPSGTALHLGKCISEARQTNLHEVAEYSRNSTREPRKEGSIGFASIRLGDVVGDHTVHFAMAGETLELKHRASSRQTFARGALTLARWVADQPPGYYTVEDAIK